MIRKGFSVTVSADDRHQARSDLAWRRPCSSGVGERKPSRVRVGGRGARRAADGSPHGHPAGDHLEVLVQLRQDQAAARGDRLVGRKAAALLKSRAKRA